jgi:polyisoprenoid-binding protein YceI
VATFGPPEAQCLVLTFREGLLAAMAHDLVLRVTSLEVAVDGERAVRVRLDPSSLRVVEARRDGRTLPGALRRRDVEEIERTVADRVLQARRFPAVTFESTEVTPRAGGHLVRGRLTLAGVTRDLAFPVTRRGGALEGEVAIHQPDFGIRPYVGALGAVRVKAGVVVRVSVPEAPPAAGAP